MFCLPDVPPPLWMNLEAVMKAVKTIVSTLVDFTTAAQQQRQEAPSVGNSRYKTNMCRDLFQRNSCPRGSNCTFAHTEAEMERLVVLSNLSFGKHFVEVFSHDF